MKRPLNVAALAAGLLACAGAAAPLARAQTPAPPAQPPAQPSTRPAAEQAPGDDAAGTSRAEKAAKKSARLRVGDPAPALSVEKWVKGDAVPAFEKGKVYVVEFWATWCGPCNASMPHLTKLQKEYGPKGLTVIGMASPGWNDTLDKVESHVAEKGEIIGYRIAWDKAADEAAPAKNADGKKDDAGDDDDEDAAAEPREALTNNAYMRAARRQGIPSSFVVDQKGNVAFIGHPMELDFVLEDVTAGTWDYTAGPERLAKMGKDRQAIYDAYEGEPSDALDLIAKFEGDYPKAARQVAQVKYFALLKSGKYDEAYAAGATLVDSLLADPGDQSARTLNQVAWEIVDPDGSVKTKNLDLAMRAAQGAATMSKSEDGPILDTVARVHWLKGDKAKAIDVQRQAVAAVDAQLAKAKAMMAKRMGPSASEEEKQGMMATIESTFADMRGQLQSTLDEYSGGKN